MRHLRSAPQRLLLPDLLLVEDLALHLRRSPSAIRALLRAGAIPARKFGRRWVASRTAVVAAIERGLDPQLRVLHRRPTDDRP